MPPEHCWGRLRNEVLPETKPVLCYVTDSASLAIAAERASELLRIIRECVAAGVDWIHIREKELTGRALTEIVEHAVAAARGSKTRILVNDRLDIAIAAGAGGVHLGGESIPVADVVKWCRAGNAPKDFLVGRSCHSLAGAQQAERDGADYIFFGPVFATPSKEKFGPVQGIETLREVCSAVKIPVLAIGGITAKNAAQCLRVGATGVAAIRMFQEAPDISNLVRGLRVSTGQ